MCSTYVLEVCVLPRYDWVTRHNKLLSLYPRTQDAIKVRMPPDLLLWGTYTGTPVKPGQVIPLRDKIRYKQTRLSERYKVTKKFSTAEWSRYKYKNPYEAHADRLKYKQLRLDFFFKKAKY